MSTIEVGTRLDMPSGEGRIFEPSISPKSISWTWFTALQVQDRKNNCALDVLIEDPS